MTARRAAGGAVVDPESLTIADDPVAKKAERYAGDGVKPRWGAGPSGVHGEGWTLIICLKLGEILDRG